MSNSIHDLKQKILNKKAVIWDFDGVICYANWRYGGDFENWWDSSWTLLEKGEPDIRTKFDTRPGQLSYYYQHTDYITKKYGSDAQDAINNFFLAKEMQIAPTSRMNNEIVELIKQIPMDITQCIWSNNQSVFIKSMLKKSEISSRISVIASLDKTKLAKPNLNGYSYLKNYINVPLSDVLFVGDSNNTDKVVAEKLGIEFFYYQNRS